MFVCVFMCLGREKNYLFGEKLSLTIKELKTSKSWVINVDCPCRVSAFGLDQGYPVARLCMCSGHEQRVTQNTQRNQ